MKGLLYLLINVVLAATEMQVMKMFRKVPGQEAIGQVLSKGEVLSRLECSFTCSSLAKGCVAYNIFKGEPLICQTLKKVTKVRSNPKVDVYTAGCVDSGDRCDSLGGDCAESCLTTEYINGSCLGVDCKCCIEKNCYNLNRSCGTSRTCRESCLINEVVAGTCGGRACKCCEKKCHNINSACGNGGTCRESCLVTEDVAGYCNGHDCKCCEEKGCPGSFINFSNQCFKYLNDQGRKWTDADAKCRSLGLTLAQPRDPVGLRKQLMTNYATTDTWLGGRGTGSAINWLRGGQVISSSSSYWYPGDPGSKLSSSYCLDLLAHSSALKYQPNTPYYSYGCEAEIYALCEKV